MSSKMLAFKVDENLVEKLGVSYGNLNRAGHRAVLSWDYLRTVTLSELKGVFTRNELAMLIDMRSSTIFDPKFAGGSALALEVIESQQIMKLADKWGIDIDHLTELLKQLAYPHAFFLSDWIDCYHSLNDKDLELYIGGLL